MFTFIEEAKWKFTNKDLEVRRRILAALGSNLLIKDKELSIDTEKCFFPIKKVSKEVRAIIAPLEPLNTVEKQGLFEQKCLESPTLLRALDEVRTVLLTGKSEFAYKIAIPELLAAV